MHNKQARKWDISDSPLLLVDGKTTGFSLDQHALTIMLMNFVNVVVILSEFFEVNFWRIFLCQWPSAYVLSSLTKSHLYPTSEIMTKNRSKVRGGVMHIALLKLCWSTYSFKSWFNYWEPRFNVDQTMQCLVNVRIHAYIYLR